MDWFLYNRVPHIGSRLPGHRRRVPGSRSQVKSPRWRVPGPTYWSRAPSPGSHFSGMLFKAGNYFKKRDSDASDFLWILGSFWENLFSKTPPMAASVLKATLDYIKVIFIVSEVFWRFYKIKSLLWGLAFNYLVFYFGAIFN